MPSWTLQTKGPPPSPWHASFLNSPPAQNEDAGRTKRFSVTALTLSMHSDSPTMGSSASLTRRGIGPPGD